MAVLGPYAPTAAFVATRLAARALYRGAERQPTDVLRGELDPRRYVGCAPEQTVEYLEGTIRELLTSLGGFAASDEAGVTV